MKRIFLVAFALTLSASTAWAQAIDLSKPYGTTVGCQNRSGPPSTSDDMLLLTSDSMVMSTSTCSFVQKMTAPDGVIVVTALCTLEGEEGRSVSMFSIVKSKSNAANLMIYDEYGAAFDEVAPCP